MKTKSEIPFKRIQTNRASTSSVFVVEPKVIKLMHAINLCHPNLDVPLSWLGEGTICTESPTTSLSACDTMSKGQANVLCLQTTLSTYAPYVPSQVMEHQHALKTEGKRVVMPYHADAWQQTLEKCGLQETYPNLVHDMLYGAPIGFPPPLTENFIPQNSSSAMENEAVVDQYLQEEIAAGHMYRGLSIEDAEIFFGGHFRTAPLAVIDEGSKFRVVHNLSVKDENGNSTNSWLNAKDNPTKCYTASMFADAVSVMFMYIIMPLLLCTGAILQGENHLCPM